MGNRNCAAAERVARKEIEAYLNDRKLVEADVAEEKEDVAKTLLLGIGEAGKSTIVKTGKLSLRSTH